MPGKPYQSKLQPYADELFIMFDSGKSYREIATLLNRKYSLGITHNAVFSFVKVRKCKRGNGQLFFTGFSSDIQERLLKQVSAEWTHDSTSIEGNTLTLGETVKVLELGLTISGKPLRDHQEVYGHARAIELIYDMLDKPAVVKEDLFDLHSAVMQQVAVDSLNPVGDWKRVFNGTTGVINNKSVYMEYAAPADVEDLMKRWLEDFNMISDKIVSRKKAVSCYVQAHMGFVRIHPFFDGNGRVARLIANLPVIKAGYPPIVIPSERRSDYIDLLWAYQNAAGIINRKSCLVPAHVSIKQFEDLLMVEWSNTIELVDNARKLQATRS